MWAFVLVSLVVICTPGPDTALTVRNAFSGGRRGGIWTAGGVAFGQAVWTLATSLGIAGLIQASEPAFVAMKLAGACYLLYLGGQSLWSAWRGHHVSTGADGGGTDGGGGGGGVARGGGNIRLSPVKSLRQGLINDLANPKMAAFFLSLLPQFATSFAGMLGLGLLFAVLTFTWLTLYSLAIDRLRALFNRSGVRRALDALTGTVLIAFGLRLATSSRT